MKKDLRIIFMGTPDFAVPSLEKLVKNGYNIVAVITAPDKPAGRGMKLQASAVKQVCRKVGNSCSPTNQFEKILNFWKNCVAITPICKL